MQIPGVHIETIGNPNTGTLQSQTGINVGTAFALTSGTDSFTVQVSDGTLTALKTQGSPLRFQLLCAHRFTGNRLAAHDVEGDERLQAVAVEFVARAVRQREPLATDALTVVEQVAEHGFALHRPLSRVCK